MRFVLFGDPTPLASLIAAIESAGHECIPAGDAGEMDAALVSRGGGEEETRRMLRDLVEADVPVLAAPGLLADPLDYYEIDAKREERGGTVMAARPLRWSAGARALAELVASGDEGPLGVLEQLVVERAGPDMATGWKETFADDVDVVRAIAGEIDELVAIGGLKRAGERLTVQLQGAHGWGGRWEARTADRSDCTVTLLGGKGRATWTRTWQGDSLQSPGDDPGALADESLETLTLREFLRAIAARQPGAPAWMDDCRALEIVDGAERSLARGRKVDVRFQQSSELDNFKSLMAATGCGLLLAVPVVLMAAGAAAFAVGGGKPGWADAVLRWAPWVVLAVLVLFLAAQVAVFFAPRGVEGEASSGGRVDSSG